MSSNISMLLTSPCYVCIYHTQVAATAASTHHHQHQHSSQHMTRYKLKVEQQKADDDRYKALQKVHTYTHTQPNCICKENTAEYLKNYYLLTVLELYTC